MFVSNNMCVCTRVDQRGCRSLGLNNNLWYHTMVLHMCCTVGRLQALLHDSFSAAELSATTHHYPLQFYSKVCSKAEAKLGSQRYTLTSLCTVPCGTAVCASAHSLQLRSCCCRSIRSRAITVWSVCWSLCWDLVLVGCVLAWQQAHNHLDLKTSLSNVHTQT